MKSVHLVQRHTSRGPSFYIQRAKWRNINDHTPQLNINKLLAFDYMGSAEFEFGAIPASVKSLKENPPLEIVSTGLISKAKKELLMLTPHVFLEDNKKKLQDWIIKERDPRSYHNFKEPPYLVPYMDTAPKDLEKPFQKDGFSYTEVWWDIANDFIVAFNLEGLRRFKKRIEFLSNEEKLKA